MSQQRIIVKELSDEMIGGSLRDEVWVVLRFLYPSSEMPPAISSALLLPLRVSDQTRVYGVFVGENLVGLSTITIRLLLTGNRATIDDFMIIPTISKQGIVCKLHIALIRYARKRKCRSIDLNVHPSLTHLENVYRRLRYVNVGEGVYRRGDSGLAS